MRGTFSNHLLARSGAALLFGGLLLANQMQGAAAQQALASTPAGCRVTGRVLGGTRPLPGAAVVVRVGPTLKAATSTDQDGKYTIIFGPGTTYHVTVDLMLFKPVE